jgi:hypothetical protein
MPPRMTPRAVLIHAASLLLFAAFLQRLYTRGGPYFERPVTAIDHVGPDKHELRDALIVLPQVAAMLPRDAQVTCFRPRDGQEQYDGANFLTAVGQLPRQMVQPPFVAGLYIPRTELVDYVVAVSEPFTHPAYKVVRQWPEGALYQVER